MTDVIDLGRTSRVKADTFRRGFLPAELKRPHPIRRMAILKAHPQVRALMGQDIWTFWITLGVVVGQAAIAYGLGHLGIGYWWLTLIVAWCFGAFPNHAMFVAIHDFHAQPRVQERGGLNKLGLILADLPNTVPTGDGLSLLPREAPQPPRRLRFRRRPAEPLGGRPRRQRMVHEGRLAVLLRDLPADPARAAQGHRADAQPLDDLQRRSPCSPSTPRSSGSAALNGLLYLFASFWFSVGLHPLGARWVQEHFTLDPEQETFDYYGPLNLPALNIGYHNEHHDFPDVPWRRLPLLRKAAPEFYDTLKHHKSWTGAVAHLHLRQALYAVLARGSQPVDGGRRARPRVRPRAPRDRAPVR